MKIEKYMDTIYLDCFAECSLFSCLSQSWMWSSTVNDYPSIPATHNTFYEIPPWAYFHLRVLLHLIVVVSTILAQTLFLTFIFLPDVRHDQIVKEEQHLCIHSNIDMVLKLCHKTALYNWLGIWKKHITRKLEPLKWLLGPVCFFISEHQG